jgi:PHD/YefM family antitoxin component YafN of YafNO toxin-antitoxin module
MVRQRHGLGGLTTTNLQFADGGGEAITLTDASDWICLTMTDKPLRLTSEQARYLADRLNEAAARIDAASDPNTDK